jgi:hypothetical protein
VNSDEIRIAPWQLEVLEALGCADGKTKIILPYLRRPTGDTCYGSAWFRAYVEELRQKLKADNLP